MSVTGVQEIDVSGRGKGRHQVFVAGANLDYTVTVKIKDDDGAVHERSPANNTINGTTDVPLLIDGRFESFVITPPDGAAYTYVIRQLAA